MAHNDKVSEPEPPGPMATPGALITAMLAHCSDVIAVLDPDTTVRYVNPVVETMLGYTPAELVGRKALDIIHPADVDTVLATLELSPDDFDAGESLVLRLLQSDGEWREVEVAASNRINQSEVHGIIVNVRDLTERRAQAEALRQQRDLVTAVIQAAATLVMVTDHEGKIVRCNRAVERTSGYPADELLGKRVWHVLLDPKEAAEVEGMWRQLRPKHLPAGYTGDWITRDGERRTIEWKADAIVDDAGELAYVVANGVDITHRLRQEEALRQSEARLRSLADYANDLVSTIDASTLTFTYASPSWRTLGFEPDDLIGIQPFDGLHRDDDAPTRVALERLIAEGGAATIETRIRNSDGVWLWFESRAQAVLDDDGQVREVQVSSRDISRRREAEQELVERSLHDPLTGLPNRTLFLDRLTTALRRSARRPGSIALLFCDLDNFKMVNDSYGHAVGDEVLVEIAHRLEEACRPEDTVGRLGGDEFVVLAEGVGDPESAAQLANRLSAALDGPIAAAGVETQMTLSVGLALTGHGDDTPESLLAAADRAMYEVKRAKGAAPPR